MRTRMGMSCLYGRYQKQKRRCLELTPRILAQLPKYQINWVGIKLRENWSRPMAENWRAALRCSSASSCIIQLNLKMTEKIKGWTQQNCHISQELIKQTMINSQTSHSNPHPYQLDNSKDSEPKYQKRYPGEATSSCRVEEWTVQQERLLMRLHNQKGNRWVEIARELHRTDNSVKNHYHSKLRKALRKINKCVADHLKTECRQLKNNLLSRVIQTAEISYTNTDAPKEEARFAFKLKNNIMAFSELSQQQISAQQIQGVRNLVSQVEEFNKKYKKTEKNTTAQKTPSNKYKGKEIISLLSQNYVRNTPDANINHSYTERENSQSFKVEEAEAMPQLSPKEVLVSNTVCSDESINMGSNMNIFGVCDGFYIFKQPYIPIYFSIYPSASPSILSGKPSSFTHYIPQKGPASDQLTWASIPRIQSEGKVETLSDTAFGAHMEGGHLENGR